MLLFVNYLFSIYLILVHSCVAYAPTFTQGVASFSFIPIHIDSGNKKHHLKFGIHGRLTHELYKTIRRRIIQNNETPEKRKERLERAERSKRDGLILNPKTSYNIYVVLDNRPADEIKQRFRLIAQNLIKIGAEHTNVYYHGLKKLAQPLNKKNEACFISFELAVYPSLIKHIHTKLAQEEHVLRVLVLRDKQRDKDRRLQRDHNLHVRHPFFHTEIFRPLKSRLINRPKETFGLTRDNRDT